MILRNELQIQSTTLKNNILYVIPKSKIRVKRQSGAGKFVEAAQMPQIKLVRLFLQMFKNTWDDEYIGGSHPLHPNVPKSFVELYKQNIVEFFIPDIEEQKGS
nr:uncharacterized protein LOC117989381 [Maniola hyperantus]